VDWSKKAEIYASVAVHFYIHNNFMISVCLQLFCR